MHTFRGVRQRLAEYRIYLERDTRSGLVSAALRPRVEACYAALESSLESARIELEAAGPRAQEHDLIDRCVTAHAELGRRMFRATRSPDATALCSMAARLPIAARVLVDDLRGELARAA
jgi:hypothetical protein